MGAFGIPAHPPDPVLDAARRIRHPHRAMPKETILADVAVPVGVRTTFTYRVPEPLRASIREGHRVRVPLGRRATHGFVVRLHDGPAPERLRDIVALDPPEPLFDGHLLELTRWVADYYLAPWGEVLEAAAPRGGAHSADSTDEAPPQGDIEDPLVLDPAQEGIYAALRTRLQAGQFHVDLLQGVPGSGKTEIYLRLARDAVEAGGAVLLLEPEIGLATQILQRVRRRFGDAAGLYHSMTGMRERRRVWERARSGDLRIIVGARSAVFVPLRDLRLIIVDEEQEPAYKQEESPRYHGRDTAIVRARMLGCPVVLGTATPSLEAFWNAAQGKFTGHRLVRRYAGRESAEVHRIDLRVDPGISPGKRGIPLFSSFLIHKIHERLRAGEQTILFLNRRGHSTIVQCSECGEMFRCSRCEVVLTYHRATDDMRCHHCGSVVRRAARCPACKEEKLFYGGVGTQKLEDRLADLFPSARLLRLDADTTRRRGSHAAHLQAIEEGSVDILVGTQMVAKGFDFPRVTLVGVLLADREMGLPEFRAAERAYQILTQVAGRAGRGEARGEVVLQTLLPEHYVIRCAACGDFDSFAEEEIALRRALAYPPFTRLVHLLFDGAAEEAVQRRAEEIARRLLAPGSRLGVEILGPAPMFLTRLKGRYRWHLSLKGAQSEPLHRLARLALETPASPGLKGVRLHVDVDPIRTL